jgi:hypothetical protein
VIGPLVAFSVSVKVPVGVAGPMLTVNCSEELALIVKGDGGLLVAPLGSPEIVTKTDPLKPFVPLTETVIGELAHPC